MLAVQISQDEQRDVSACSPYDLMDYVRNKIYGTIAANRQSNNLPELHIDTYSQNVMDEVLMSSDPSKERLMQMIEKNGVVCQEYDYIQGECSIPDTAMPHSQNVNVYQNQIRLAEETIQNNWSRLIANSNITHLGLATKKESGRYRLGILTSKRYMCPSIL